MADYFAVLIIGGGFGVGPVESLVKSIGRISGKIQLLVVCGWNKELYERVNKLVGQLNIKAKVWGFINNVDELMSASDLLVTKAGGLTSSEALAKTLPAVFIRPIPGQEKRNGVVLEQNKAAFVAYDVAKVRKKVKELIDKPYVLKSMSDSVKILARPNSAREIVGLVMRFVNRQ
jgi:processive 1,2-diacylglycerol beta-glucosyltransferase